MNAADVARSVLLLVPREVIDAADDPGEPDPKDRETVVLKSGPSAGRPWRRKPRLQVRMQPDLEITQIRRALAIALQLGEGGIAVSLSDPNATAAPTNGGPRPPKEAKRPAPETKPAIKPSTPPPKNDHQVTALEDEVGRLESLIASMLFEPLKGGVKSRQDALFVLGFPPWARPDRGAVRRRFRELAAIHHPDSRFGDHERMSQINAASELLGRRN